MIAEVFADLTNVSGESNTIKLPILEQPTLPILEQAYCDGRFRQNLNPFSGDHVVDIFLQVRQEDIPQKQ